MTEQGTGRARDVMIGAWQNAYAPHEVVELMLEALSDAGIRLAGPGEVAVDVERFERVRMAYLQAEDSMYEGEFLTKLGRRMSGLQDGDLDPLPAPDAREAGE